jgi:hypothetical protein
LLQAADSLGLLPLEATRAAFTTPVSRRAAFRRSFGAPLGLEAGASSMKARARLSLVVIPWGMVSGWHSGPRVAPSSLQRELTHGSVVVAPPGGVAIVVLLVEVERVGVVVVVGVEGQGVVVLVVPRANDQSSISKSEASSMETPGNVAKAPPDPRPAVAPFSL